MRRDTLQCSSNNSNTIKDRPHTRDTERERDTRPTKQIANAQHAGVKALASLQAAKPTRAQGGSICLYTRPCTGL
jgi:hypothetical protein